MTVTLTTDRLVLRPPVLDDYGPLRTFMATERARFVGGPMLDEKSIWRILATVAGQWTLRGYGLFVMADPASGAPLGTCGCWHPIPWPEPELAWTLWSAEAEGKGLVTEAATAARRHVCDTHGWTTLVSYVDPGNARSIATAERLGCALDPAAERPDPSLLVYRHPRPGAAS